jgi:hypothetical protein
MIAALTAIVGSWRSDPEAAEVIALASRSKVPEIRNAVRGQAAVPPRAA